MRRTASSGITYLPFFKFFRILLMDVLFISTELHCCASLHIGNQVYLLHLYRTFSAKIGNRDH